VALLLPTIRRLTERQHQLFFLFHSVISRYRPEGFGRLADEDVADAAAAVAATLETAAKGVIYQHAAQSAVAQQLAGQLTGLLKQIRDEGATVYDGEAALALRAIEQGARTIGGAAGKADTYLDLMGRVLQVNRSPRATEPPTGSNSIILP
jgi:hypothetical protein